MMSPLEYLFVMMMKSNHPDSDAAALNKMEPAAGVATLKRDELLINKSGYIEMRTILMEPHNAASEMLEAPLRITAQWEKLFRIGTPIALQVDESGQIYSAHISRIETIKDESGESIQVIAVLPKSDTALKPGQTATATMVSPKTLNN